MAINDISEFFKNFNSRPHEEVDENIRCAAYAPDISTHDLTKRSTNLQRLTQHRRNISTHDLTKRSTIHLTAAENHEKHFNSRPHEEVDRSHSVRTAPEMDFNSRPHEEVDMMYSPMTSCRREFQLTTSRRGRHGGFPPP